MSVTTERAIESHYRNDFLGQMALHPSDRDWLIRLCPHDYLEGDEFFVDRHDIEGHEAIPCRICRGGEPLTPRPPTRWGVRVAAFLARVDP